MRVMLFNVGRVCVKIAGREAGHKCVIVKKIDNNFVLIDGDVRRRKCNINHLMPLEYEISIKTTTKSDEIKKELIKLGLMREKLRHKEKKEKKPRPRRVKKKKVSEKVKKESIKKTVTKTTKKSTTKTAVKKKAVKKTTKKASK